jgi:putative tryptophan/tyrosine transport system substrate-binding protein
VRGIKNEAPEFHCRAWKRGGVVGCGAGQQNERVRRIGALFGGAGVKTEQAWFAAFVRRLDELGWKRERNVRIELRWGNGNAERLSESALELLAWHPDVIFVFNNLALAELKPLAPDVPIVFAGVGDPVGDGFVASLSRPGGNITGFESFTPTMGGKWLEVLKQAVPPMKRVLALMHEETAAHRGFWQSMEEAAVRLGVGAAAGACTIPPRSPRQFRHSRRALMVA